jgi:hypothetical protein
MKLKDLMGAPLIRDDDTVTLILELKGVGTVKRKGSWFQDCILELMDKEIKEITYKGSEWIIYLKAGKR